MATRATIRQQLRDKLYEQSADLFSDDMLNRAILDAIRKLPRNGIYKEKMYTIPLQQRLDYPLPQGVFEVEKVSVNTGTDDVPGWKEIQGTDTYAGALWLPFMPTTSNTMRIKTKVYFTDLESDVTVSDIPNDKLECLVKLAALGAYENLMSYFMNSANWDTVAKPEGADMNKLADWYRTAKREWTLELQQHRIYPRPRTIDLIN